MSGAKCDLAANRIRNRTAASLERDRLAKQRKKAAERQMGIRRCRRGHIIQHDDGYCRRCRTARPVSEAELVEQILALDRQRELAPSHEWPAFRARIAELSRRLDELDRKRRLVEISEAAGQSTQEPVNRNRR